MITVAKLLKYIRNLNLDFRYFLVGNKNESYSPDNKHGLSKKTIQKTTTLNPVLQINTQNKIDYNLLFFNIFLTKIDLKQ